jgi:hypothetical protein
MGEYEIRIIQPTGSTAIVLSCLHLSDAAAIQAARRMSLGRQFEVWKGMECITGLAKLPPNAA